MAGEPTQTLGLVIKVFSAASALAGLVALWLSYSGKELHNISPRNLAFMGVAFIGLSILIGAADLVQDRAKDAAGRSEPARPSDGITTGDITGNAGQIVFGSGNVFTGETENQKRDRRVRAVRLLAGEIASRLVAMDSRLHLVAEAFAPDDFERRLDGTRRRLAPATADGNAEGYRQLIAVQRAASLRHALNSAPLRPEIPGPHIQAVVEAQAPGGPVRFFHAQLAEVERVTESLLATLEDFARQEARSDAERDLRAERIALGRKRFETYTRGAYLDGLRALDVLGEPAREEIAGGLAAIRHLQPRQPLDEPAYTALRGPVVQEMARLNDWLQRIIAEQQRLRDLDLERLAKLEDSLRIDTTDSWSAVVAKAKSLRDLGRVGDAIAAFGRYGEMFAASDPTAAAYARSAQQFTYQMASLGVRGGVYLFEVRENGPAAKAGLRAGDILVGYAGNPLASMPDFVDATRQSASEDAVRIEFLRLAPDGGFTRRVATVPGGLLGVGAMPI